MIKELHEADRKDSINLRNHFTHFCSISRTSCQDWHKRSYQEYGDSLYMRIKKAEFKSSMIVVNKQINTGWHGSLFMKKSI